MARSNSLLSGGLLAQDASILQQQLSGKNTELLGI